jgi:hypothetical protein
MRWSILESIVGGAVVVIATWYLHRGLLLSNFPHVAAEIQPAGAGLTVRLLILSIASLVVATAISHSFDFIIPALIGREKYIGKRYTFLKRIAVYLIRLVTFTREPDPRITPFRRYLAQSSTRREWLLAMAEDWAKSPNLDQANEDELIRVHQHFVTRLRVLSESSRALVQQAYTEVVFSGSMFVACLILIPIAAASFVTETEMRSFRTQLIVTGVIYLSAVVWGFFFRWRLRIFFSQVVTIALHCYDVEKAKQKTERDSSESKPTPAPST